MKIFYDLFKRNHVKKNGIISIGYFDSFHLGHRKLIGELVSKAEALKKIPYVLTYINLPQKNKQNGPVLDLDTRIDFIRKAGIRDLILCEFNERFHSTRPENFIDLLKDNYNINHYVVGSEFHFGKNKQGSVQTLLKKNCMVDIVEPCNIDGERISTSLIRKMILSGDVEQAARMIGRKFFIEGIVHKGKQLGRIIGFPTMNIRNEKSIYPGDGTYATKTTVKGEEYFSMTYVDGLLIETNLFGYGDYQYNLKIKIDFFKKIRDNKPFSNIDDLKIQLFNDLKTTRSYFKLK